MQLTKFKFFLCIQNHKDTQCHIQKDYMMQS